MGGNVRRGSPASHPQGTSRYATQWKFRWRYVVLSLGLHIFSAPFIPTLLLLFLWKLTGPLSNRIRPASKQRSRQRAYRTPQRRQAWCQLPRRWPRWRCSPRLPPLPALICSLWIPQGPPHIHSRVLQIRLRFSSVFFKSFFARALGSVRVAGLCG